MRFAEGLERTHALRARCHRRDGGRQDHAFRPGAARCARCCPRGTPIKRAGNDALILAGFIDCHVHYPQTQIIGAYGAQLIDWLEQVHLRRRAAVRRPGARARSGAGVPRRNACVPAPPRRRCIAPCIPQSVEAFFEAAAEALDLRMIAGKVLMDRNAPAALPDTAQTRLRRVEGADREVARPGPPALRRDAAFRGHQHAASRWR